MGRTRALWLAVALAPFWSACADETDQPSGSSSSGAADEVAAPVWFEECAVERGIVFDHVSGHRERHYFPEIMGGGAALFDAEGDGDLDAYLVQSGSVLLPVAADAPTNLLFSNDGEGRFRDVTAESGTGDPGYGMGVAWGDVNNDGHADLYVLNLRENVLYVNDGGGRFSDTSAVAGVDDAGWSVSGAFFDPDRDGDLDLFVVNYLYWTVADDLLCSGPPHGATYCSPKSYDAPAPDELYANQGDGTFRQVSTEAGLRTAFGNGLGVVTSDIDGDGWEDVYVANDGTPNQLWRNLGALEEGGLAFEDAAVAMGCAVDQDGTAKAGMGVSVADTDDDGDEDLLVVNLDGETDSFYRNDGGFFSDRTPVVGLARTSRGYTRFGCGLVDLNNDGWLDFFTANGRVIHPPQNYAGDPFAETNLLYRGEAGPRFREVLPRGGTDPELVATSRAAAFGDVDGDGGLDILIVNRDAPAHLLRNVAPERGAALRLRVLDQHGRDAFGARVSLALGERRILRTVRSAYSYGAANEAWIHLGLGADVPRELEALSVLWPTGETESFGPLPLEGASTSVVLRQGEGR